MSDDDFDDKDDAPDFDPSSWKPTSMVEQALAPRGLPVQNSEDLTRVINLPRRAVVAEGSTTANALIEIAQQKFALPLRVTCECREIDPQRKTCVTRLLWAQAWMLYEIEQVGGLLSSCPVGGGKTIVGLLAPLALQNSNLCLLLIPPTLVDQIVIDYRLLKQHFYVPNISVHQGKKTRNIPADHKVLPDGRPVPTLHVLPYSRLSSIEASNWIENLRPDAIICDEVDALKSMESARTLRILRYYAQHWATTKFMGWTGSLTDSSVGEFGHLAALALREGSPMPLNRETIEEWGRCLDAVPSPAPPGALIRLLNPGESIGLSNVRRAFQRRIAETPGFIVIGGRQVIVKESDKTEVELDVCERQAPPIPDIIREALDLVRHNQRPDKLGGSLENEIIVDPMEQARCAREVASGVFNRIVFPNGEPKDLIIEWLGARKNYFSELRMKMLRGEVQLDSPKLCERAAMRAWGDAPRDANLPEWRSDNWPRWRDVMDKVKPASEPVRLHSYLVDDAIGWAHENIGIVWYLSVAWGRWMHERSRLAGATLPLHEGGPGAGDRLRKEVGKTSIIASLNSHGRGRNGLQFVFNKQLLGQVPSSATRMEQMLGRLHRRGQEADTVRTWTYLHTEELQKSFEQALRRAEYVESVMGAEQKLLGAARFDPGDSE